MNDELRDQLLRWMADDDATRERLAADGSLFQGYHPEMEAVHRRNAAGLAEVVARHGWPGRSLVGDDGAAAAWRIVQHAISEPELVRGWLPVIREAAERGEADPAHLAMLEDRICVNEGRLQRYGTQYDWSAEGDAMVPMVGVEDPDHVDDRRRAVGLPPLEWRRAVPPDEPRPADPAARRREMEAWAKRVGWR